MDAPAQIKARLPLEEVVGEVVALKGAGAGRFKGLCPFHQERTPSFHVVADKGYYYCFGCHAKGDLFDFVQATQNLDFAGALEVLAARAGVTLDGRPRRRERKTLLEVNALAQRYFAEQLAAHPHAQGYLESRGLTPETVAHWGLGYAPAGWRHLLTYLRREGVGEADAEAAGLARSKDGRTYDLFRDRLMIPIHDALGRVVGFSGRTLGGDAAKYVNTPETAVFHKGDLLFGLHHARGAIREAHAAILVEGQLDVIALHQAGFTAAVGAQSATLTNAQVQHLVRLGVSTLYLAFDSDEAGQRATLAGCDAVARSFVVKVVALPGKDPAEVVQHDPGAFRTALRRALSEPRFRVRRACEGVDTTTPEGQRAVLERLGAALKGLRPVDPVALELQRLVAQRLTLSPERLREHLATVKAPFSAAAVAGLAERPRNPGLEAEVVALALRQDDLFAACDAVLGCLEGDPPGVLGRFLTLCREASYDAAAVWEAVRREAEFGPVLALLAKPVTRAGLFESALKRLAAGVLPPLSAAELTARLEDAARRAFGEGEGREAALEELAQLEGLYLSHVAASAF